MALVSREPTAIFGAIVFTYLGLRLYLQNRPPRDR